jgi:hypothetical protein
VDYQDIVARISGDSIEGSVVSPITGMVIHDEQPTSATQIESQISVNTILLIVLIVLVLVAIIVFLKRKH